MSNISFGYLADTFAHQMVDTLAFDYKKNLEQDFNRLFEDHRAQTGSDHFIVGNKVYFYGPQIHGAGVIRFQGLGAKLHPDHMERFEAWIKEYDEFRLGHQGIQQTLRSIVMRAKNWQDIRDMFPEYVISRFLFSHPELSVLDRTRPDLFAGPVDSPEFTQNFIERACWDVNLINMYGRIGGMLSVYVGYKYL